MNFDNDHDILDDIDIVEASGTILSATALIACVTSEESKQMNGRTPGSRNVTRERVNIEDIIQQLSKRNFRRASNK